MSVVYCTRGDVNRWLPSGEITGSSKPVASALASTDTLEVAGHGFETDDQLTLRAVAQGALPVPLVAGTIYYARRLTNSTFQLAATPGGAAIDLTTDGVACVVLRDPPYDDVIAFYSRFVDGLMPSHLVPFPAAPNAPQMVKVIVAELSAKKLLNLDGKSSEIMNAAELAAKAQLERYAAGLPLRGDTQATPSANLAVNASQPSVGDPRGWNTAGGRIP